MTAEAQIDGPSLQRFLDAMEPDRALTVTSCRPISGGYSRLSALADVRWADGQTERLVLRADPPPNTGVFVSDRDEEWRLLQALSGKSSVLTPTPRWYDATGEYFGAKCLIVNFFQGRPLCDVAQNPADLDRAATIFVDTVADLHQCPLEVLPPQLDRPSDWETYIESLVDLLERVDQNVADTNPAVHYAAAQLRAHRPPPAPLTLVHGDCQPANVLVPDAGPVLVIDWEFGRVGDPREDLGYYSHLPVPPNLYEVDRSAFLTRYRDRTGLTEEQVNEDTVDWFVLLGMARLLGQMFVAADALAQGESRGVMATYIMNGTSAMTRQFFEVAQRLAS